MDINEGSREKPLQTKYLEQLKEAMKDYWCNRVTPSAYVNYIDRLQCVLPAIVAVYSQATGI